MVARFEPQDVARRPAVTKSTMDRLMPRYVRRGSRWWHAWRQRKRLNPSNGLSR